MNNLFKTSLLACALMAVFILTACDPEEEPQVNNAGNPPTLVPSAVPVDTLVPTPTNTPEPEQPVVEANESTTSDSAGVAGESAGSGDSGNEGESMDEGGEANVSQPTGGTPGEWTADARLIPFDSFEFGYRMETTRADGSNQFIDLRVQNSKPLSITLWSPMAGGIPDADMFNSMQMGVFENNSFLFAPGMGCIWSNEGGGNDEMLAFNTDSFLSFANQPDAVYEGIEMVNGLETQAYTIGQQTLVVDMPGGIDVQEATGRVNVYPLEDGQLLIIKSSLRMVSNYDMFAETFSTNPDVVTEFSSEIRNINELFDIQIPAECEQQANNFPYPLYPGAFIATSMPGISVLEVSGVSRDEVIAWYQTEMENGGWTQAGTMIAGPMANYDFIMGDQKVTISFVEDQDGKVTISFFAGQ